jgi:hypothetical protein
MINTIVDQTTLTIIYTGYENDGSYDANFADIQVDYCSQYQEGEHILAPYPGETALLPASITTIVDNYTVKVIYRGYENEPPFAVNWADIQPDPEFIAIRN